MAGISVESSAVANAITLCKQSITQFNKASGDLGKKYQDAGRTWKDAKYKQLGTIVTGCTQSLSKPVRQLEECITRLEALRKAIEAYEQTSVK